VANFALPLYAVNKEIDFVSQSGYFWLLKEASVTDNHWLARMERK